MSKPITFKSHKCWAHILVIMNMLPSWWFRLFTNYRRVGDLQDLVMIQFTPEELNYLYNLLQEEWEGVTNPPFADVIIQKIIKQHFMWKTIERED